MAVSFAEDGIDRIVIARETTDHNTYANTFWDLYHTTTLTPSGAVEQYRGSEETSEQLFEIKEKYPKPGEIKGGPIIKLPCQHWLLVLRPELFTSTTGHIM